MCILSWGRALGLFGGLSTRQLMLPALHGKKEKKKDLNLALCSKLTAVSNVSAYAAWHQMVPICTE